MVSVKVGDETGHVRATWFNQPWVASKLVPGTAAPAHRQIQRQRLRSPRMGARARLRVARAPGTRASSAGVPDSPRRDPQSSHGPCARSNRGDPSRSRSATGSSRRSSWAPNAIEGLPAELRARRRLAGVGDALRAVHFPDVAEEVDEARERLGFEELFLHQALLATRKRSHRTARPAPRFGKPGDLVGRWLESLPFEPTGDQLKAFDEIEGDLDSGEPMQRLLMGEVGSGKTVVAVYSMLRALEAGYQAALMAPTETLAEQHAITLGRLLAEEAIPFALLTGVDSRAASAGRP